LKRPWPTGRGGAVTPKERKKIIYIKYIHTEVMLAEAYFIRLAKRKIDSGNEASGSIK